MKERNSTLFDQLLARMKNHPLGAYVAVGVVVLGGALALVNQLLDLGSFFGGGASRKAEGTATVARSSLASDEQKQAEVAVDSSSFSSVMFEEYARNAFARSGSQQTELQRQTYVESMMGKRVIWSGRVSAVTKLNDGKLLLLIEEQARSEVAAFQFGSRDRVELLGLKRGDTVQVTGVLTQLNTLYVGLEDSRLLRVSSQPSLSEDLCSRHIMTARSQYAEETKTTGPGRADG
jgi:hypothetical protein